ncbi:mechanosensitive ion channel [Membranicola marinus]|uniref:Mechanosensitive ion channel n=1 Tax=Membranihabitans marinus TaxID=1227546 RepID=A0A953HS37_9BACT|nr:mechanosensitive ion channel family protein [Membranihabitans marinus]MBY5957246.1 mechanosensitive ion channel [Membranihabitans marinus]
MSKQIISMEEAQSPLQLIWDKLLEWYRLVVEMLPNFVLAVIIVIGFYFLARLIKKIVGKLVGKLLQRESLIKLLTTITYVLVIIIGMFVALSVLKLDKAVTSLLAGAGIIGLALAFAFQDFAANFMAGIMMAVRAPFKVGDLIETNDIKGRIKEIQFRTTELLSLQGQLVVIPNKDIFQNPLFNFSQPARYRVDLDCGVSYGDDLEKVRSVTKKALEHIPHRMKEKDIEVFFKEFGGSSINLEARVWIEYQKHTDFLEARSEAVIAIKKAYDEADIMIPFPIRTLDFGIRGGETLAEMAKGPLKKFDASQNDEPV